MWSCCGSGAKQRFLAVLLQVVQFRVPLGKRFPEACAECTPAISFTLAVDATSSSAFFPGRCSNHPHLTSMPTQQSLWGTALPDARNT